MTTFIDTAAKVMSQAERRVEIVGQNISNVSTPGYKRRVDFASYLGAGNETSGPGGATLAPDLSPGQLNETGNPYDLAIAGQGFFVVNVSGQALYTRQGQFHRDADGRLVTLQGFPVQAEGGGDIALKGADLQVLEDGTVVEAGEPVAKLAIVDLGAPQNTTYAEGGLLSAASDDVNPSTNAMLRQGALETSNVSIGHEMVTMMEALRHAEAGQRLAGVYDDLMNRVLTSFGQP